jgi:hypothetical protein
MRQSRRKRRFCHGTIEQLIKKADKHKRKPELKSSKCWFKSKLTPYQRGVIIEALGITIGGLVAIYAAIQWAGYMIMGGAK